MQPVITLYQPDNTTRLQCNAFDFAVSSMGDIVIQAKNSDLIIFPEMFFTGYSTDTPDNRLICPPVEIEQAIGHLAYTHNIAIVCGYEYVTDTKIYNAVGFWNNRGKLLSRHFKTVLFVGEELRFSPPIKNINESFKSFTWHFNNRPIRIGLCICFEIEFPEIPRMLATPYDTTKGADIIIAPSAIMGSDVVSDILVPARAVENQCFVVFSNYGSTDMTLQKSFVGKSCVVSPLGVPLVKAGQQPNMITTSIDITDIQTTKSEKSDEGFTYIDIWQKQIHKDGD